MPIIPTPINPINAQIAQILANNAYPGSTLPFPDGWAQKGDPIYGVNSDGSASVSSFTIFVNDSTGEAVTVYANVLKEGDVLKSDGSISSSDGRFVRTMRNDGNLVILDRQSVNSARVWSAATTGIGNYLKLAGGKLAVYDSNKARSLWGSL